MIGFYNYTVFLTYLSLISGTLGIVISLSGNGHPFIGSFFLLFSGLCDAFDGKVARTKPNRTSKDQKFGIQIDSLSDLVAFGVLPACIGAAMFRGMSLKGKTATNVYTVLLFAVISVYVLAALIRLAYFNVTEEERQQTETGSRKRYTGLPVTSAALIFPTVLLVNFLVKADITPIYLAVMVFTAFAFVSKIEITKPGIKGILILVGIGAAEFVAIFLLKVLKIFV